MFLFKKNMPSAYGSVHNYCIKQHYLNTGVAFFYYLYSMKRNSESPHSQSFRSYTTQFF